MKKLSRIYGARSVLVTGDTGFKGSWLCAWLDRLGARVHGFALPPEYPEGPFAAGRLDRIVRHRTGDVREARAVRAALQAARPEIIFHLAAQPIVRLSYEQPLETLATNVLGTAHVLDAARECPSVRAVVVVTSDKCYENREIHYAYREGDPMGGHDVYSMSKGCAELVTSSWRRSFFGEGSGRHPARVASARAGNVIGPGDWSRDRILPDAMRALKKGMPVAVRNPHAVRPWQHVLEPLSGYLWLGAKLMERDGDRFADAWNFGPTPRGTATVGQLMDRVVRAWGGGAWEHTRQRRAPHEAGLLRLSIRRAAAQLAWRPAWNFARTVQRTVEGYRILIEAGAQPNRVRAALLDEIETYARDARAAGIAWAS